MTRQGGWDRLSMGHAQSDNGQAWQQEFWVGYAGWVKLGRVGMLGGLGI